MRQYSTVDAAVPNTGSISVWGRSPQKEALQWLQRFLQLNNLYGHMVDSVMKGKGKEVAEMSRRYHVTLDDEQRVQLDRWVKNPPKPYLRDRARAILAIAGGEEGQELARRLRTPVHRTTVGEWVRRYQEEGISGLKIRSGRGRKPLFSPSDTGESEGAG